ncbi:aminotransferase class IV [Streptomyces sp. NPDC001941]|uniref:aminotransferase class IV n=1 Tax=Streptomyces sp. NPDC001941 TaxID=3154659 RepID=UPI00331C4E57
MTLPHMEIDGEHATADLLAARLLDNYGHFTAMQVRDGRVRGLAHHLRRLDEATRELFGAELDGTRVREHVRHALATADLRDASVRVHVHWPQGYGQASLMVIVRPPQTMDPAPKRLVAVEHAREVAHIKHLGGFGQAHHWRAALREGYDEALLTLPDGTVTEGAITNVAFWDGTCLVWPQAPSLLGMTMAVLAPRLPSARRRVTVDDLGAYRSAFVTNSQGLAPVRSVEVPWRSLSYAFEVDEELVARVRAEYEAVEWDVI